MRWLLWAWASLAVAADAAPTEVERLVETEAPVALPAHPFASFILQPRAGSETREDFLDVVSESDRDLWIVTPLWDSAADGAFGPDDIARMKVGSPGRRILAWLPIGFDQGELATWPSTQPEAPVWVIGQSRRYHGASSVAWWHPAWRERAIQRVHAVADAGFDGVVLGGLDAFRDFELMTEISPDGINPETGNTWRADMTELADTVASIGRSAAGPGFSVMTEGGAELLADAGHRSTIDGIVLDGLFFSPKRSERIVQDYLVPFAEASGVVVVVEDPAGELAAARAASATAAKGFGLLLSHGGRANLGLAR